MKLNYFYGLNESYMNRNEYAINKIKELYKQKGYSVEGFAKLIGKSKSAWLRRESGEVPLTIEEVDFIADKIGSEFGTLVNEVLPTNIVNVNGNSVLGTNVGQITINLTQDQLGKVIDALK